MKRILFALLCFIPACAGRAQGTSTTYISPSVFPANPTYADAVTAQVSNGTTTIAGTGTITYTVDGGAPIVVTIANGRAPANLGQLSIGSHTLATTYSGDKNYAAATEAAVPFTVSDLSFAPTGTQSPTFFKTGSFTNPAAVVVDTLNNIYVADSTANRIQKLDPFGNITTLAVTGLSGPTGLAIDSSNNLYIADTGNSRVLMVTPKLVQTTLTIPGLGHPGALAYDSYSKILYIVDQDNDRILVGVTYLNTSMTLVSGLTAIRGLALSADAPGSETYTIYYADKAAGFNRIVATPTFPNPTFSAATPIFANVGEPAGIGVDRFNHLYLADRTNNSVLLVDASGHQTAINNATDTINALTVDADDRVLVALGTRLDALSPALTHNLSGRAPDTQVGAAGIFQQFFAIPQGQTSFSVTGAPAGTFNTFGTPVCTASARNGQCTVNVTFSPKNAGSRTGTFTAKPSSGSTVSGLLFGTGFGPQPAYLPAPSTQTATTATVSAGVALGPDGAYYVSDSTTNKVYKTLGGVTTTLGFTGLNDPGTVQVDALGAVYVHDRLNERIVKLDTAGNQTVLVQQSSSPTILFGTVPQPVIDIYTFTLDAAGRIFVAGEIYEPGDTQNRSSSGIYIYDQQGNYTLFTLGDNFQMQSLAVDPYGLVYGLSYTGGIFRFDQNGTLLNSTVPSFRAPATLAIDAGQNAYIASPYNESLYYIPANVTASAIPIAMPGVTAPAGIAIDALGDILVADSKTNQYTYFDRTQALYAFGSDGATLGNTLPGSIANAGNQPFTVLTLPGNANYVQAATQSAFAACAATTALAPGGFCDLSYTFTPSAAASYNYTGAITTSAGAAVATFTGTGVPTPALTANPTSVELSASAGQSATSPGFYAVKNTGTVVLTNVRFPISGTGAADFSEYDYCTGATLNPGDICNFNITFKSATAGMFPATLTILATPTGGGADVSATISLMGNAPGASYTLTPANTDFGKTLLFTTTSRFITVTNTGNDLLTWNTAVLGGDTSYLTIAPNTGCYGNIYPGENCSFTVNFSPNVIGPHAATFTFNPQGLPSQTVNLTDNGDSIVVTLTPATADFGTIVPGSATAPMVFTVTNTNAVATSIGTPSISAPGFTISANTCGSTLAGGASCTISVVFSVPAGATPFTSTGTLTLYYSNGALTSTLTGTVGNAPAGTLTPNPYNYGPIALKATATQDFTLKNTGNSYFQFTAASVLINNTAFAITANNCTTFLQPGGSCVITVGYTPTANGAQAATLSVSGLAGVPGTVPFTFTAALSGTGITTGLSITPAVITFPSTAVGQASAAMTATLSNSGTASVYLSNPTLTDATDFTQSNNCNGLLAGGASCTITFGFRPQSTGALTSTFSVADLNNPASPVTVVLNGTATAAPAPQAALTPATASFGSVQIGQTATQTLTLSNAGTAALPITGATIAGTQYTISSTTCGTSLGAGASCTYLVTFTPTGAGTATATFSVTDAVGTQSSSLSGTATAAPAPQAALTPATASFGSVQLGQTATQTLTLSNAGSAALPITANAITAGPFSLTGQTCTTSLAAGASCTFTLSYNPTTAGTQTATFSVTDSVGTQTSSLTGTATAAPTPQATLTPATASFGTLPVNTTSAAQTFTLSNAGTAILPITSSNLAGAGFTLTANTCNASLAAGASCTLIVTFTPVAAAAYSATLTVVDSVGTQTSTLTGIGAVSTPPDFTVTPSPAAQSSYRGQSVAYTIALASLSGGNPFTGPVTLTAAGLPPGATATFAPATVVPGASSTLTISVPALTGANRLAPPAGMAFAALFAGLLLLRRRRIAPRLLAALLGLAAISAIAGCGTGAGFNIPTSTSTITVTGTSGTVTHSTTVSLTVK